MASERLVRLKLSQAKRHVLTRSFCEQERSSDGSCCSSDSAVGGANKRKRPPLLLVDPAICSWQPAGAGEAFLVPRLGRRHSTPEGFDFAPRSSNDHHIVVRSSACADSPAGDHLLTRRSTHTNF